MPTNSLPDHTPGASPWDLRLPDACLPVARRLFAESDGEHWQLSFRGFQAALARGAAKRFGRSDFTAMELEEHSATLHLRDLALACACAEGSEPAWEELVLEYRTYLRSAAAVMVRRGTDDPIATELADSLFSDLYGVAQPAASGGSRSLLRYFHGRSSLKTWLRAVLAQRHVDAIRAGRRFDSLDDTTPDSQPRHVPEPRTVISPADPHRGAYLQKFSAALTAALAALDSRDRTRLQLYYAEDKTLAEIGRQIGEHESSVSRNLERLRKELRATVEGLLRAGSPAANGGPPQPGMDDAQVALCVQYAAEDAAIDLDKLFEAQKQKDSLGPDRRMK
jgi:RNA polymerase sigma factor (sigma-70 family)